MANMTNQKGFTLAEMLITLGIMGILTGAAVPAFNDVMSGSRVEATTGSLEDSLHLARSEAITRGAAITVAPVAGNDWSTGWNTFIDRNGNGAMETGEDLIQVREAQDNVSIAAALVATQGSATAPVVTYMADGSAYTRSKLTVCVAGDADGKVLEVSSVGRSRPAKVSCTG